MHGTVSIPFVQQKLDVEMQKSSVHPSVTVTFTTLNVKVYCYFSNLILSKIYNAFILGFCIYKVVSVLSFDDANDPAICLVNCRVFT